MVGSVGSHTILWSSYDFKLFGEVRFYDLDRDFDSHGHNKWVVQGPLFIDYSQAHGFVLTPNYHFIIDEEANALVS